MSAESTPIRLDQGLNYRLNGREVGVMNVYREGGSLVVQLSVFDPATSTDDVVYVRTNDALTVGGQRYRVVDVRSASVGARACLQIAPE
jgi:hypothetical protein